MKLIRLLQNGDAKLTQISKESDERKGQGVMLGTLVCWDKEKEKRIILYSVSGNGKSLSIPLDENSLVVPSIAAAESVNKALQKNDKKIHELTDQINQKKDSENIQNLILERSRLTTESLQNVFNLYSFTNINHKQITLNEIISCHNKKLPPTGTGDCCAPKLLSYAFENNLEPISMDEVYFGGNTKNKINGQSYDPCDERCGYILPFILGLEILYRDKHIVVINKPSGLLSVPGRGEDKKDSVEARLQNLFSECIKQPAVHRLDMETSGILILALNKEAHKNLEIQFSEGKVKKQYIALLDGVLHGKSEGRVELKFRLDVNNRPHQIYDEDNGKLGITNWKKLAVEKWQNSITKQIKTVTRVEFLPETGRTHQLRLASSHKYGLGLPILGDSLYGSCTTGERLMLHASSISFYHPISGEQIKITCNPDF